MEKFATLEKAFTKGFEIEDSALFAERRVLAELAQGLNRLNIDEKIKAFGVNRVFRVLAATVNSNPSRYDPAALYVSGQVPPLKAGRCWEEWFLSNMHPAFVQENILRLARLRAQ